jgi:hypothetical protein
VAPICNHGVKPTPQNGADLGGEIGVLLFSRSNGPSIALYLSPVRAERKISMFIKDLPSVKKSRAIVAAYQLVLEDRQYAAESILRRIRQMEAQYPSDELYEGIHVLKRLLDDMRDEVESLRCDPLQQDTEEVTVGEQHTVNA